MGTRVILHIGAMKSGTTFLQSALVQNRQALADAGCSYLGGSFDTQTRAVREVVQPTGLEIKPRKRSRWLSLVDAVASEAQQTAIVSMEFLSFADDEAVGRVLEPLADFDVSVIVTVRDQSRAIPAQWQTYTRSQGRDDWPTYLRHIRGRYFGPRKPRALRNFRRAQDVGPVLERWRARPEVDELAVITVPPPGAPQDELWLRFCRAAGIPPMAVDLSSVHYNPSLGYASCDYLRRINRHLADVPLGAYRGVIRTLARQALVQLREDEGRPHLNRGAAAFAYDRNGAIREAVSARADRLVGTLDDLPLADSRDRPRRIDPPRHEHVVRAAEAGWDHVAAQLDEAPGERPRELDRLVADGARLMRLANGWDR